MAPGGALVAYESELGPVVGQAAGSWFSRLRQALARDAGFYVVIGVYFAGAEFVSALLGWRYLHPVVASYLGVSLATAVVALCAMAAYHALRPQKTYTTRLERALAVLRAAFAPQPFAGLLLFNAFAAFMGAFTSVKTMMPLVAPFWSDNELADLDRALFLGQDPWRLLHNFMGHPDITRAVEFLYGPVWMVLMVSAPFFFCMHLRSPDLRRRFLTAFLFAWIINGTVVAGLTMSAGPAFYGLVTGDGHRFGELVAYLQFNRSNPLSAAWGQHLLWSNYVRQGAYFGAGISAFPSLHVTMSVLFTLAAWRLNRKLGAVMTVFAAAIVLGSVHLGWHYAADGIFGAASMLIIWWAAGLGKAARQAPPVAVAEATAPAGRRAIAAVDRDAA